MAQFIIGIPAAKEIQYDDIDSEYQVQRRQTPPELLWDGGIRSIGIPILIYSAIGHLIYDQGTDVNQQDVSR